jgi:bis(5'-nucleosidyl)-tetraphosphatase
MKIEEESYGVIPLKEEEGVWKVLIIMHRGSRHWAFPKGHGDPGETPLQSAHRELKEETGLEVEKLLQEVPLIEKYQFYRKHEVVVKTVQYFPALVHGTLQLQPEEISAAKWVPLKEASKHLTFTEARVMCQKVITLLKL